MNTRHAMKTNQDQKGAADPMLSPGVSHEIKRSNATSTAQPQTGTDHTARLNKGSSAAAKEPAALSKPGNDRFEICELLLSAFISDLELTLESPRLRDYSLSPTSVRALLYLFQHSGKRASLHELAEGIHVSHSWASRLVNRLASAGLVNEIRDEEDRRLVRLCLTEQACAISIDLWNQRATIVSAALTKLAGDDSAVIKRFLYSLTAELTRNASNANAHCG